MKTLAEGDALIAFEDDIRKRSWLDWLRAHTSFMKPLHRYEGSIKLYDDGLYFSGTDKKKANAAAFDIVIRREEIFQIYHGHDKVFNLFETRGLGLIWKPLRISYTKDKDINMYLIINYRFGRSTNAAWFQILRDWLTD